MFLEDNKTNKIDKNGINVYTDGSCLNNGKKNASAGIGIYFDKINIKSVSKKYTGKQTNNCANYMQLLNV